MTLGFYTSINAGSTWTQRATMVLSTEYGTASETYTNATKQITVDGLGSLSGAVFKIKVESEDNALSTIDAFGQVTYLTGSSVPSEVTATPTGAPDVGFDVIGGLDNV